jgi:hypothetical protein
LGGGAGSNLVAGGGDENALTGASGGTLVSPNPGGYELRHFPSGGTFAYSSSAASSKIHVLVVAGGGGGTFGGGGAGGVAYAYNLPVPISPDSFTIAIGGGGDSRGNGGDSTFAGHPVGTITTKGGGGGTPPNRGNWNCVDGTPGGSGGGAGHSASPFPAVGTTTQPSQNPGYSWGDGALYQYGQPGGLGNQPNPTCCEGGGGGGAIGPSPLTASLPPDFIESGTYRNNASENSSGDGNGGGAGGNGITFAWVPTSLGDSGYFAGGGGGSYAPPGGGGAGGGGNGSGNSSNSPSAVDGVDGTGGGGGGGNSLTKSGGDGIVLVYYPAS